MRYQNLELLNLTLFEQPLRLEASTNGEQKLFWQGQLVSVLQQDVTSRSQLVHRFELNDQGDNVIEVELEVSLSWQPFKLIYCLTSNGMIKAQGERSEKDIEQQQLTQPIMVEKKWSTLGLLSLGFKLFKSAKMIKVAFAGASLAAYSWLFSFQFALALLACLVFHE